MSNARKRCPAQGSPLGGGEFDDHAAGLPFARSGRRTRVADERFGAQHGVLVEVAQGHIVTVEAVEGVRKYGRRAMQIVLAPDDQAVAGDDVPLVVTARRRTRQWFEGGFVFDHGSSPHDDVGAGHLDDRAVGIVEEQHLFATRLGLEAVVNRLIVQRIVIADKQHDGSFEPVQLIGGPYENVIADSCMIEQVSHDENRVDVNVDRQIDRCRERSLVTTPVVAIEMYVRGVQQPGGPLRMAPSSHVTGPGALAVSTAFIICGRYLSKLVAHQSIDVLRPMLAPRKCGTT